MSERRKHAWIVLLGCACLFSLALPLQAQMGGMGGMGGGGMGGGGMGGMGGMGGLPGGSKPNEPHRYRPAQVFSSEKGPEVVEIKVVGNRQISTGQVLQQLVTKPGRPLDSEALQNDVRKLIGTGMFEDVQTRVSQTPQGAVVTYQVKERPLIREIQFVGNQKLSERKLLKKSELRVGSALTPYRLEEARRKLHEYYLEAGYTHAQVTVAEDSAKSPGLVTFQIVEGPKQRIWQVEFVGNSNEIASDARLRTLIQSKGAIPMFWKSTLDMERLDADVQLLTDYYRRLGFFMARISRELKTSDDGTWSTIQFVIDEGPRYKVRNVQVDGNGIFATQDLQGLLKLTQGNFYDRTKMDNDLRQLRDAYGSQGYIFADIQADIQFLEQPGELDLVYSIQEGDPYYVRDVRVNIRGDNPHTRHSAIMNYVSISPMDIVDIREIRDSKRRLGASQIVETNPAVGPPPDIRVVPADMEDYEMAGRPLPVEGESR